MPVVTQRIPAARAAAMALGALILAGPAAAEDRALTFAGGHEIGREDHGRPCVLIAAALGVPTPVFRQAFAGVAPARGRGPSGEEARRNKAALMRVLAPYRVTNERLDEVSDYYRFRPQDGELWEHRPARAHAVVEGGKVVRVVVTDPGAGYSSPPKAAAAGIDGRRFVVKLHFDRDLRKNGSVESVEVRD